MNYTLKNSIVFYLLLKATLVYSQMVNIESKRMQTDSIRFASINEFSSWFNDNNGQYLFSNTLSSTNQFKSKNLEHIFLILGNYNVIFSKSKKFQNAWLLHARYNYQLSTLFRLETFVQYNGNRILDVEERFVGGIGIRLKPISSKRGNLYLGNSFMIDLEENNSENISYYRYRNNLYISVTSLLAKDKIELTNTIYWQPNYADLQDFNILEQFKFSSKISKNLNFFLLLDYFLDSRSPLDRVQYYFSTKVGVGIKI